MKGSYSSNENKSKLHKINHTINSMVKNRSGLINNIKEIKKNNLLDLSELDKVLEVTQIKFKDISSHGVDDSYKSNLDSIFNNLISDTASNKDNRLVFVNDPHKDFIKKKQYKFQVTEFSFLNNLILKTDVMKVKSWYRIKNDKIIKSGSKLDLDLMPTITLSSKNCYPSDDLFYRGFPDWNPPRMKFIRSFIDPTKLTFNIDIAPEITQEIFDWISEKKITQKNATNQLLDSWCKYHLTEAWKNYTDEKLHRFIKQLKLITEVFFVNYYYDPKLIICFVRSIIENYISVPFAIYDSGLRIVE